MDTLETIPESNNAQGAPKANRMFVLMDRVPPPRNGTLLQLNGRKSYLPRIYRVPSHKLAPKGHSGHIYIAYMDYSEEAMEVLFDKSANTSTPVSKVDMESKGFLTLYPSRDDLLYMRNMYGTGREEDDHLATYSHSKGDCSEELISALNTLRESMLGKEGDKTPTKPSFSAGVYSGGIAFERHHRAVNIDGSERSYQLASTIQIPKLMSAPGVQAKASNSGVLDDDAQMRKDILQYGATLAMKGLHKHAPPSALKCLEEQADITNLPSIGINGNFAYPAWQLNVASATGHSDDTNLAASLGKFGGAHVDKGDSVGVPTSMTVLSKPHPDVPDEYFYLLDLGICWRMDEYSTLFFSGLHFHGGSQPRFSATRTSSDLAERLTLIGYLPDMMIEGNNNVAFAALPQHKVLKIGLEMRNPISHRLSERLWTEQALYTPDGSTIFEPISHLNNFSRSVTEVVASFCSQYPPNALLRFDRDKLISCFSVVIDGKRTAPEPWDNGPGWTGADAMIGTDYTPILESLGVESIDDLDDRSLATLYNSDSLSQAPYGNAAIDRINNNWAAHTERYASVIPICAVTDANVPVIGGRNSRIASRPAARGGAVKRKRKRPSSPDDATTSSKRPRRKAKPLPKIVTPSARRSARASSSLVHASDQPIQDGLNDNSGVPASDDVPSPAEGNPAPNVVDKSPFLRLLKDVTYDCLMHHLTTARSAGPDSSQAPELQENFIIPDATISSAARTLWSIFDRLMNRHDATCLGLWSQRQHLLVINMLLWEWLETSIEREYVAKNSLEEVNGVRRLINDVEAFWVANNVDRSFVASQYLDGFTLNDASHLLNRRATNRKIMTTKSLVVSTTTDIIVSWLAFPQRETFQLQAWFTRYIINTLGFDVLLLPEVWKASRSVRSHFLSIRLNRMEDARSDIHQWAIDVLPAYSMRVDPRCADVLLQISSLVLQRHPLDPGIHFVAMNPTAVNIAPPVNLPSPTVVPSTPEPAPPYLLLCRSPAFRSFYSSISLLYPFLNNPDFTIAIPSKPADSAALLVLNTYWTAKYLAKVRQFADKRLPFRDHAPSRRRILQLGGPFSAEHLSTRSGFFSALIYRGVTHNTAFLHNHTTIFRTLDDWTSLYDTLSASHPRQYFCNRAAYGQCATARSVDNIESYWELSGRPDYLSWITSATPMPFRSLFEKLQKVYAFGFLTAYQLTVDYATAGKATIPSFKDMGYVIKKINAGAVKGLKSLGFTCGTEESIALAFEQVYLALKQCIPEEQQVLMQYNVFTVEHALCKLERLVQSGLHNIVF